MSMLLKLVKIAFFLVSLLIVFILLKLYFGIKWSFYGIVILSPLVFGILVYLMIKIGRHIDFMLK